MIDPPKLDINKANSGMDARNEDEMLLNDQIFGWIAGWWKIPEEGTRSSRSYSSEAESEVGAGCRTVPRHVWGAWQWGQMHENAPLVRRFEGFVF